ncbi:MAG: MBL fold metallo-hydrolase [Rhodospirillales bacterium]|nr:MBL fold metallo-hydrolase [Rhodospirillales bacterium]
MRLTLLGTGCPQCDPDRLGPANLVRHAGLAYLVDCGSGVTQRLIAAGAPGRSLDAVFLTHLHSDHIVDLFQLVISSWHQGRDRPQRLFGPKGTQRFVDGMMALWRPELDQRIAHERRPSTVALDIEVTEIGEGEIFRAGDFSVSAFAVDHRPVREAFGFAFAGGGKRLVFSGDTARCPAVVRAARRADALVHECFIHREMKPAPGMRTEEGTRNVAAYHTLSHEVGKIAAEAEVGCLILNHFVPTRFDRAALLAEVRRDFAGTLVIGEDLLSLDLDSGVLSHADARIATG